MGRVPHLHARPLVLVVEDESLIRACMAETLIEPGCEALEAASGQQALDIVDQRPDIWVMFSDIVMPGSLDGLALAHRVRETCPAMHLILTSGRGAPDVREMPANTWFVPKPYGAEDLANRLMALRA